MSTVLAAQLGPLTWVKPEIDLALERTRTSLDQCSDAPEGDGASVSAALTAMREVTGALQIIGMDALGHFSREVENVLEVASKGAAIDLMAIREVVSRATGTIGRYLADLMAGQPENAMCLLPVMKELARVRGAVSVDEQSLFYPDLAICPPPHPNGAALEGCALATLVKAQRSRYQRGMVSWLRQAEGGLETMRGALLEVERAQPQPQDRTLWWIAAAFVEALLYGGLSATDATKRLAGKIDRQFAALISGTGGSADLIREILFSLSQCEPVSPLVGDVKLLYRLDRRPEPTALVVSAEIDADRTQCILREIHQALGVARSAWTSIEHPDEQTRFELSNSLKTLRNLSDELGDGAFREFVDFMLQVEAELAIAGPEDETGVRVEVAAALIAAERLFEGLSVVTSEAALQLHSIREHLRMAFEGTLRDAEENQDEPTVLPDDRQLVSQVAREILSTLREIEQTLDAYFRGHTGVDCLGSLDGHMRSASGALRMLGLESPAQVIDCCASIAARLEERGGHALDSETALLADGFSSVVLHTQALELGYEDDLQALDEILARFATEDYCATIPPPPDFQLATDALESADSGEIDLDVFTEHGRLDMACLDFEPSENEEEVTPAELAAIVDHFDLSAIVDEERDSASQLEATAIRHTQLSEQEGVCALVSHDAEVTGGEADGVLVEVDTEDIDKEIVSIFLEEATEILAELDGLIVRLRANPDSEEDLRGLRRCFHTLKGSGRMAGLHAIGDAAWTIEDSTNAWLEHIKPASEALIKLSDAGRTLFSGWITNLAHEGRAVVRTGELDALAKTVAEELSAANDSGSGNAIAQSVTAGTETAPGAITAPSSCAVASEVVGSDREAAPGGFHDILIEEARQCIATLRQGIAVVASSPDEGVLEAFTRAAHTLGGIARAGGFADIGLLAALVENAPIATADREKLLSLTSGAVQALETMIDAVAAGNSPTLPEAQRERFLGAARILGQASEASPSAHGQPADSDTAAPETYPEADISDRTNDYGVATALPYESRELIGAGCVTPATSGSPGAASASDSIQTDVPGGERATPPEPERRSIKDDIDGQLLPVFLEEVRDLVPLVGENLRSLRDQPNDGDAPAALRRLLHTIKGGVRMVGAIRLGELVHVMEARLEAATEKGDFPEHLFEALEAEFDRLTSGLDALGRSEALSEVHSTSTSRGDLSESSNRMRIVVDALTTEEPAPFATYTRVTPETLDSLVNQAGEIGISRGRIEAESRRFKQFVLELKDSVARLRSQLREIEIHAESRLQAIPNLAVTDQPAFDPLEFDRFTRFQELTRLMAESLHDVTTVEHDLTGSLDEIHSALSSQSRLNRSLQDDLMRLRTVPFQNLGERLHRLVRQVARETKKKVKFEVIGAQIAVDRGVLERVAAPLEHLIRNAVTHGIEPPDRRVEAEKPETGTLRLTLRHEAKHLEISLSDDGAGIDHQRIRDKAAALGWIPSDAEPSLVELEQMIFLPGFSTANEVSELAGRGIGMDVVANEVRALGGSLEISTEAGKGTNFAIQVPLTVAVAKAVLVTSGGRPWAILASLVEQVQEVPASKLQDVYSRRELEWKGQRYPLFYFSELIREKAAPPVDRARYFALLIHSGDRRVWVLVDEITVNHDLVLKKMGPQLARLPGVSGATVLSGGEIVLILNPVSLAHRTGQHAQSVEARAPIPAIAAPLVMVVDDSLTVRNVTSRLLTRHGYRVATARDGLDALQQIQETPPDVLLADIEMPRMDGFDLTKNCKASPRTASIPIIMITSRLAPKHREYAQQLGVSAYLGKPYEETELLSQIARVTASTKVA